MSFQPLVGGGGMAGWRLLQRTSDQQIRLMAKDPAVKRAGDYFRDHIGSVKSADDLVGDYRLLRTALSAFGLEADINSRSLIRKVLESDLSDRSSLANRLTDKRYRQMAEAFGFGAGAKVVRDAGFAANIASRVVAAEFEKRVGAEDDTLRLALSARRELTSLAASSVSDNTKWYTIIGSTPLRTVFTTAFGLGSAFGRLPVERQLDQMKQSAQKVLGSSAVSAMTDPVVRDRLVERFLLRAQIDGGAGQQASLSLLISR